MNNFRLIKIISLAMLFALCGLLAQQPYDNSFQSFQTKVSSVISKTAEQLTEADVKVLKDLRNKDDKTYGDQYQKIIKDYKTKAVRLIQDYENQNALKSDIETKGTQINKLGGDLNTANQRIDTLQTENVSLKAEIEKLNVQLKKLDKQKRSMTKANRELQLSHKNAVENLEMSRNAVKSMMNLLGNSPLGSEMSGDIPKTLSDTLNQAECSVAQLLMNNYLLTLKSMQNDKEYMDSVVSYMRIHKEYPAPLYDYFDTGIKISDRLKNSKSDCAKNYAQQIQDEITKFQGLITSNLDQSFFAKLKNMIGGIGAIVGILLLLLAFLALAMKAYNKLLLMASYIVKDESGRIINTKEKIKLKNFEITLDNQNVVVMKAEYPGWKNISNKMSKTAPVYKVSPNTGYQFTGGDINGGKGNLMLSQRTDPYSFDLKETQGSQTYKVELKIDWIK